MVLISIQLFLGGLLTISERFIFLLVEQFMVSTEIGMNFKACKVIINQIILTPAIIVKNAKDGIFRMLFKYNAFL